jgi:NAD(P) transhydrogenase
VQAAKLGKRVVILDKRREVGGVSVNTGTIPSKTLREAVIDLSGWRQRQLYGDEFRPRADVTVQSLLMRCDHVMTRERNVIRAQLQRNGVQVLEGNASFAGPNQVQVESDSDTVRLTAPTIVIAVGSVPGVPPGLVVDHQTTLTSDDILTLSRLPRLLTIVGAGIIGVEYAAFFAVLGIETTLVDMRPTLLDMVDQEVAEAFAYQIRQLGITLRLGEEVARIECPEPGHPIVVMKSGKRLATEMILISAGRVGATAGLALEQAGLTADARGRLTVNADYQTKVPHIYAVGDVIGAPGLASTAAEQGRHAACHAFGLTTTSVPELLPYGIYAIPEISWVGARERDLTTMGVPFETGVARYREIARGQILGDEDGMLKLIFHLETRKILGVWVLGTQATELVHIGQAVMALGGTLDYFVDTVFNYPTLAECYKVAALDAFNKLRSLGVVTAAAEQKV